MHNETRALFAEADVLAERTVAKLRVAVAAILVASVLLLVVRPALGQDDPALLRQVSVALGSSAAFLVHGMATLAIVRRGRYRPWMAWVFATVDVALLLGAAMLALRASDVPGAWLAAMPALWVAPLILAFGALRFDPWVQGWVLLLLVGGLVWVAVATNGGAAAVPAPPGLAAEPANMIRLVMLALTGVVLVLAARRARLLLNRGLTERSRRQHLTRYLPPQIAQRLAEAAPEDLTRGSRQPAAVMFADIRGFTRRAEAMTPEAVGAFITEFRHRVTACADRHGGVVDKFIGDAAMVVFGVPDPDAAAPRYALACARDLLTAMDQWSEELAAQGQPGVSVGIGLHWGEVFCGAVGDSDRLEFTVLGDTVNVAARLQDECKAHGLGLIASRQLLEQAGEAPVGWVTVPPHALRGRDGAVQVFGQKPVAMTG